MSKDIEQYRAGFEAWIVSENGTVGRDQRGRYVTSDTRKAWKVWIAAKEAA